MITDYRSALARTLIVALGMLALGACTTTDTNQSIIPVEPSQEAAIEVAAVQPSAIVPEPVPEPEPEVLISVPEPDNLIGYSPSRLKSLFGEPSFVRSDPPAELWQYKNASCIMDLYLYNDGSDNFAVTHLEFRQTEQSVEKFEQCLRLIITNTQALLAPEAS
jgi:hypothetical protein